MGLDRDTLLAAFTEQIRRRPRPDGPHETVEHDEHVVRVVSAGGGWNGVVWSDLDESNADAVIAAELRRFAAVGRPWEWKHYSHDRPADLPDRLRANGFVAEPAEALLVAEVTDLDLSVASPDGVTLRPVVDAAGVADLVHVHDTVFGGDHAAIGGQLLHALSQQPPTAAGVVAYAGDTPVGSGRVVFHDGTEFASMWGDGTVPAWRGRGVFRAMVSHRAALAAARGFRYVQVDAAPDSYPLFLRLGFVELATTTPFAHEGLAPAGQQ